MQDDMDMVGRDSHAIDEAVERAYISGRIDRRQFVSALGALGLVGGLSRQALAARLDQLEAIRANQAKRAKHLQAAYDYIVVGTGSAGCALVGRLAERTSARILVIEAGGWDVAPSVMAPGQWFTNLGTERDWNDVATATASVNNRAIPEHMGKVVGGGSSINATIWVRPYKSDLDHWADEAGDPAWSYDAALPVFRRMENWQGKPDSFFRGQGGPVWCQPAHDPHPLAPAMLEGCRSLGLAVEGDLNGPREVAGKGFALMNHIIRDGQRVSMARAYLYAALARPNVTLLTNAEVERLIVKGDRVVGVEMRRNGKVAKVFSRSETILAAGAINTPKILMLSGIGDRAELAAHGIACRVHSPQVGKNFQDHLLHGGCIWEPKEFLPLRNSGAEASGFWPSDPLIKTADINLVQIELPYASEVIAKQFDLPSTGWALCAGLVAPKSRGSLRLRSANPADRPIVEANFLSHPDDVKALARGIELARSIGNSAPMREFVKHEIAPGRALDPSEMENFIRDGVTTFFHMSGTCRMGKDAEAVVDSRLRVNGVSGLRIADSSIMPRIVRVATMATCVLVGERMADILMDARSGSTKTRHAHVATT